MNNTPCRKEFTKTLLELARQDSRIVALASDSRGSVTLGEFADTLPEQFVECGIAEQDEVGIAAGLATFGFKPFVCAPACFLSTRSVEQIKVDVAYSHTNVKIIGISGGVSYGALGMSHHSLQDLAVMRAIPGIKIMLPADEYQMKAMTEALVKEEGAVYVRMGRSAVEPVYTESDCPFEIGKANVLTKGRDAVIFATGETVVQACKAAALLANKGLSVRVVDVHTIKPLDTETIAACIKACDVVVSVEEHSVYGGLGEAVAHTMLDHFLSKPMKIIGFPDEPLVSGESTDLFAYYGLDGAGIAQAVESLI